MSRRYLTPLPGMLASAVGGLLNQMLRHDPKAAKNLPALEGRVLAIGLEGLNIDLYFTVEQESLRVLLETSATVDTWIRGGPGALAGMSLNQRLQGGRINTGRNSTGGVRIEGDAELARAYQQFFSQLQPDWEEALAQRFGDVIGYRLAQLIQRLRAALSSALQDGASMSADYLQEESQLLITPEELEQFLEAVDELRDDVDRLASRIARLQPRPT